MYITIKFKWSLYFETEDIVVHYTLGPVTYLVILHYAREHQLLHAERHGYELVCLPPCEPGDLNLA